MLRPELRFNAVRRLMRLWTCGQRKRVAYMPTATTEDTESLSLCDLEARYRVTRMGRTLIEPPTDFAEEAEKLYPRAEHGPRRRPGDNWNGDAETTGRTCAPAAPIRRIEEI